MALSDVIERFSTQEYDSSGGYTVTRIPSRSYGTDGKLQAPSGPTSFLITGGIQPTNGRDLEMLLEAGVTSESRKIYTETRLFMREPGQEPDKMTLDGESWTVFNVVRWQGFDEVIYECLIARDEQS